MPRVVGFEPTIPVFERAKIFRALDRAATVVGYISKYFLKFLNHIHRNLYKFWGASNIYSRQESLSVGTTDLCDIIYICREHMLPSFQAYFLIVSVTKRGAVCSFLLALPVLDLLYSNHTLRLS
jgi:hypothetical protein